MIAGQFHVGSGTGNQLAQYVMTRVIALDKNYQWGMMNPQNFKGNHFMALDMGEPLVFLDDDKGEPYPEPERYAEAIKELWQEAKEVNEEGLDIRGYDERILKGEVPDNVMIEGIFQGEKYWQHHKDKIRNWLAVEPLELADDICIINIRGGEYRAFPNELLLPKAYWDYCIDKMKEVNPNMRFQIHTDDEELAQMWFPQYPVVKSISVNWRHLRYAKYLILSNSSFSILPSLLNQDVKLILAPKYHARHNLGFWALKQNYTESYTYVDKQDYENNR